MHQGVRTGQEAMLGRKAVVIKDIDPEGKVQIWGEVWRATGGNQRIPTGTQVKILDIKGLVLIVEALN